LHHLLHTNRSVFQTSFDGSRIEERADGRTELADHLLGAILFQISSEGTKEKTNMKRKTVKMIALGFFGLALALGAARPARAQDAKNPYPTSMAPLDQYLMNRDAEIAMARSAAPPSVAKDATVMVFGRDGYETAIKGTNGFVCNVDRSWMDRFEKSREFWNPKRRGPVCYNPQAAKTLLPILLIRTKLALSGK
jgi:hypothetical protein